MPTMRAASQEYRIAALDELTPHPRNPRHADIGAIFTSIEANGWYGALVVQKSSGHVLAGNHRLEAARSAGAATIPILELDVDDETALRILIADNRTSDLATNDEELLAEVLVALAKTEALLGTGYDGDDVDDLLKKVNAMAPPAFPVVDPSASTNHTCPSCGFEFN